MKKDLSFGRDYANLVSPDQNVKENIWKHGKGFVFDGTSDGDAGYGTFNFKVDAPEYLPKKGIVPVELRLWRFEIERRVIVCAVAQHFMATYTPQTTSPGISTIPSRQSMRAVSTIRRMVD